MPFGAVHVVALVVLPVFLGCDVEDDVLFMRAGAKLGHRAPRKRSIAAE